MAEDDEIRESTEGSKSTIQRNGHLTVRGRNTPGAGLR